MKQKDDWHLTDQVPHESGRGDPFAAAVRATRMPMVVTDPAQPDNPIVFVNEAFQRLTGYSRDEIIGRNCRFLQGPETNRDDVRRVREAIDQEEAINVDLLNYRKDGTTFWNALSLSPVRNEDGAVSFFFASQLDISDRVGREAELSRQRDEIEEEVKRRTAALQQALAAKDLLLHEVDHRVKNNLTMIGSLIRLQARRLDDPELAARLEAMLERVDALSMVHRRLYQAENLTQFDVGAFVRELVHDLIGASGRQDIVLAVEAEPLNIPSSSASAVGLALNELTTNAIKHGFRDGRSGTLTVTARGDGGSAVIRIDDDGYGLPDTPQYGLGRTLVQRLSQQVGGSVTWESASPGTTVTFTVPLSAPAG